MKTKHKYRSIVCGFYYKSIDVPKIGDTIVSSPHEVSKIVTKIPIPNQILGIVMDTCLQVFYAEFMRAYNFK